ncbi:MAG: superoxide dismutase [Bacteroidales bacterium]|nr:superoxide dismutase [Bacteroidales bacterium]
MATIILPALPFLPDALEPVISQKTIEFHYGKHHQAYVNNLNNLIKDTAFFGLSLEQIIMRSEGSIFNNAAQVWNHTFYWDSLRAPGQQTPDNEVHKAIISEFGSFEGFLEKFTAASTTLFGAGWAWLIKKDNKLEIAQTGNAETPMRKGQKALLTIDVWEHAYYLDYQNRRPDYIKEFMKIINWDVVNDRFLEV